MKDTVIRKENIGKIAERNQWASWTGAHLNFGAILPFR